MISIIVPIYNVEKYLVPCVDSILNSTYRDIEVILVDDGATDGSGAICDEYAARDERIKVIHKVNGGLSDARNAGMKVATGDYILFVDGDDVIHYQMIEILKAAIDSGDYDFSMVLGVMVPEDFDRSIISKSVSPANTKLRVLGQRGMMAGLMGTSGDNFQYMVAWNKLYKRSLLQDMRFKITSSEDMEWNTRVCMKMTQAVCVETELYYWIQHEASITHQPMSLSRIERVNSYLLALNEIPSAMKLERSMCLEKLLKVILHTRYHARTTQFYNQAKAQCHSAYDKTIGEYLASKIPWYKKYGLLLFYHVPILYRWFLRVAEIIVRIRS